MTHRNKQFSLLKGIFKKDDAKEVLSTLFNDKIQYHRLRNFSFEERFGKPEPHALERIAELKMTLESVMKLFNQYEDNVEFEIQGDISIRAKE